MEGYACRGEAIKSAIYPTVKGQSYYDNISTTITGWSPNNLRRVFIAKEGVFLEWFVKPAQSDDKTFKNRGKNFPKFPLLQYFQLASATNNEIQARQNGEYNDVSKHKSLPTILDIIFKTYGGRTFQNLEEIYFLSENSNDDQFFLMTDLSNWNTCSNSFANYNRLYQIGVIHCGLMAFLSLYSGVKAEGDDGKFFAESKSVSNILQVKYKTNSDKATLLQKIGTRAPGENRGSGAFYELDIKVREKLSKINEAYIEKTKAAIEKADATRLTYFDIFKVASKEVNINNKPITFSAYTKSLNGVLDLLKQNGRHKVIDRGLKQFVIQSSCSTAFSCNAAANVKLVHKSQNEQYGQSHKPVSKVQNMSEKDEGVAKEFIEAIFKFADFLEITTQDFTGSNILTYSKLILSAINGYIGTMLLIITELRGITEIDDISSVITGNFINMSKNLEHIFKNDSEKKQKYADMLVKYKDNISGLYTVSDNWVYVLHYIDNNGMILHRTLTPLRFYNYMTALASKLYEDVSDDESEDKSGDKSDIDGEKAKEYTNKIMRLKAAVNLKVLEEALNDVLGVEDKYELEDYQFDTYMLMSELSGYLIAMINYIYSPVSAITKLRKRSILKGESIVIYEPVSEVVNKYLMKTGIIGDLKCSDILDIKHIQVQAGETDKYKNKPLLSNMCERVKAVAGILKSVETS